ncbi:hypothetical protein Tco_1129173 [Tanacetum coccineum]
MKTLEYSSHPQHKEGTCSMWEKIDDITFAQDVISTLHKFSVTKTIVLTYMAITLRFKEQLIMVRNDLEVVKAAASTPESSDESTKPVEISQTLQLATMFGVWYSLNIYFYIFYKQVPARWDFYFNRRPQWHISNGHPEVRKYPLAV